MLFAPCSMRDHDTGIVNVTSHSPFRTEPALECLYRGNSAFGSMAHRTELLVIYQFFYRRVLTADRALAVAGHLHRAKAHVQRVPEKELSLERRTDAEYHFYDLGGLDGPDHAGDDPEDARFLTGRHHAGRRRYLEQAAVARALARHDRHHLSLEAEYRGAHERFLEHDAGVVHQIPRRKVITAVHDNVVVADDVHDIAGRQPLLVRDDLHIVVQRLKGLLRGIRLEHADAACVMRYLALEIGHLDPVVVDHADRPHARGRKIVSERRTEPSGSHEPHLGLKDLLLALASHFGKQDVPAVAHYLVFGKFHHELRSNAKCKVKN